MGYNVFLMSAWLKMPWVSWKSLGRQPSWCRDCLGPQGGPTRAQGAHFFQGAPFFSGRRADRGAVTGTAKIGWKSQLPHAAEGGGNLGERKLDHKTRLLAR